MMYRLVCLVLGHRWSPLLFWCDTHYEETCDRCGHTEPVKDPW